MASSKKRRARKGLGTTEWVLIAAVITLAIVGTVTTMGTRVNAELGTTAGDVADPAALTQRFGDDGN